MCFWCNTQKRKHFLWTILSFCSRLIPIENILNKNMHKANMIMPVCSASPMLFYFYPNHLQIFPGWYKIRRFAHTKSVYFFITIKSIKKEKKRERKKLMRFTLRVMRNFKWRNGITVCQCHFIKWIFFCCLLFNRIFYGEGGRQICKWGIGWEKMRKNKIKYNTQLQSVCFCVFVSA